MREREKERARAVSIFMLRKICATLEASSEDI